MKIGLEYAYLTMDQFPVSGKDLPNPHLTGPLERTDEKTFLSEFNSRGVRVGITGDLAQDGVIVLCSGQVQSRSNFRTGQIREGKPNQNYRAG